MDFVYLGEPLIISINYVYFPCLLRFQLQVNFAYFCFHCFK